MCWHLACFSRRWLQTGIDHKFVAMVVLLMRDQDRINCRARPHAMPQGSAAHFANLWSEFGNAADQMEGRLPHRSTARNKDTAAVKQRPGKHMNTVPDSRYECPDDLLSKLHNDAYAYSSAAPSRLSGPASGGHLAIDESEVSDDLLLEKAMLGSHPAFIELCRRYNEPLRRRLFRMVLSPEDTEDIVQDTVLSAYLHLGGFRRQCKFSTWFTEIGINKALMLLRKRRARPQVSFDFPSRQNQPCSAFELADPSQNPERSYSRRQIHQQICEAVHNLPSQLRQVIECFYGSECSITDIADVCGISVPAAKSRLLRARRMLRVRTAHLLQ
jgi:RNA polymerase sigma-70 factor, ECF subfamily